jgi:carboxymethylenebutenolidase
MTRIALALVLAASAASAQDWARERVEKIAAAPAAAFVFYGPPPDKDAMKRIQAPVYGFYAGNDARIDATLPATREQMKAAGKVYDPVVYEGAGHGFMRAGEAPDANEANRKARAEAWERGKSILKKSR